MQKKHKGTALAEDRLYFFLVQETMPKNTGVFWLVSIGSDTVMTVAPDSHRIPYYLPGKKPFVPYFRYSVKDKYSIKGEEMQEGEKYYENKKRGALAPRFAISYY